MDIAIQLAMIGAWLCVLFMFFIGRVALGIDGLFSVPAPPFRFTADGGVFLLVWKRTMWHLDGVQASLSTAQFSARLDLSHPERGLVDVRYGDSRFADTTLLSVTCLSAGESGLILTSAPGLAECYVRGDDLVAKYHPAGPAAIAPEIYWRCVSGAGWLGVEIILSLQTLSLDARPVVDVQSRLPDSDPVTLTGFPLLLFRASSRAKWPVAAYAELISPADGDNAKFFASKLDVSTSDVMPGSLAGWASHFQFRLDHLEKGVIRRVRVRGVLLIDREIKAAAESAFAAFCESPLPLTT